MVMALTTPKETMSRLKPGHFTVRLGAANGWRLDPDEVAAALTPRTKMVVVCDPVNPFGTVQTREELGALCRMSAERGVVILADTTHSAIPAT